MATCHVVLLPFMAYGHMIPMADMAVLLASHGVQTTVISTSSTAHLLTKSIQKTINYTHQIALHVIDFKADLPPEIDNPDQDRSTELMSRLFEAIPTLQEPFDQFVKNTQPTCIIADMFFPWTIETAAKFNIPGIAFNGSGFFPMCVSQAIQLYQPHVLSDSDPFVVPHLPHEIKLTKKQLPRFEGEEFKFFLKVIIEAVEAEAKSYGVIFNSFYELEPEYVHYYREVMKRKAWHIGPVSLFSCRGTQDKLDSRGKKSAIDEHECMQWLESKPSGSVIYVSFGTLVKVTSTQLYEIAMGLEACDVNFIWVIKNEVIPDGLEARMQAKGKGLIIKGWAPQVLILDHDSVGGFVTHCGWNSVLEGICGGVAMVAWPVMAEQCNNAKLVTDVLQIGVPIVADVEWRMDSTCEGISREAIASAVTRVMGVKEGDKMRVRAQELKEKANTALKRGGSSYSDLTNFIEDMKTYKSQ